MNSIVALLLALLTTVLGLFFIGTKEDHDQMITQHLGQTLVLRMAFTSSIGLVGAGLWWGVNAALLKGGLVRHVNLRRTAWLLVGGILAGSLAGALLFCFL